MARLFFALQPQQEGLDQLARALPQDLGALTDAAGARYEVIGRWPLHEQPSP